MRKFLLSKLWLLALAVCSGTSVPAQAQQPFTSSMTAIPGQTLQQRNWAEMTFSSLRMDFGTVPKGATVARTVTISNPFKEDIQITNAQTTCGCFQAKVGEKVLKTRESTTVSVSMDTIKFSGQRDANLDVTMTFNGRDYKSVRIPLRGFIRTDFDISPSSVNLATVEQGQGATRHVVLRSMRPGTQVTSVKAANPLIQPTVRERYRDAGRVEFEIAVALDKSAPLGAIRDTLHIQLNDPSTPELQVEVVGNVEPDLVVTPQNLTLGNMRPGVDITKIVTIRAPRPFSIDKLERDSDIDCWRCKYSRDKKNVHLITLTMKPPETPGDYSEVFTISIPGRTEPVKVRATGTITSSAPAISNPSPSTAIQASNTP